MRDGWVEATFGDLLTLEYGTGLTEAKRDGTGYPVYGSAGIVGWHLTPLVEHAPWIVVGRKGTAGSVIWSDSPGWPIDTTYWVKLKGKVLLTEYAYLLLQAADLPTICAQTGVPGLNRERVYSLRAHVPSSGEQRRIVDLISSIDAAISRCALTIVALDRLLTRLVDSLVSEHEESQPLGDIAEVKGGKRLPKGTPWAEEPTGHPYIRVLDIRYQAIDEAALVHVPAEVWPKIRRYVVKPDDVVISIVGTIGEVAVVPDSLDGANLTENAARIRVSDSTVNPAFLATFLASSAGQREIARLTVGTTQAKLALFRIEKIEVPRVSPSEQRRLVALTDSIRATRSGTENEKNALIRVRAEILSGLLSGEHEIPDTYDRFLEAAS